MVIKYKDICTENQDRFYSQSFLNKINQKIRLMLIKFYHFIKNINHAHFSYKIGREFCLYFISINFFKPMSFNLRIFIYSTEK